MIWDSIFYCKKDDSEVGVIQDRRKSSPEWMSQQMYSEVKPCNAQKNSFIVEKKLILTTKLKLQHIIEKYPHISHRWFEIQSLKTIA